MTVSSANSISEKEKTGVCASGMASSSSRSTSCMTTVRQEINRSGERVHPWRTPSSCLFQPEQSSPS
eukprot:5604823-Alexandrium_andersonii.AAC.1